MQVSDNQVSDNKVVYIHYTLRNDAGEILDQSAAEAPLGYLHGNGNIIVGLESALAGRSAGDKLGVDVAPAEGYGERAEQLVQDVPREAFGDVELETGMRFNTEGPQGPILVTVTEIKDDVVQVDGNHPLAGETLHFDVEIHSVRDATETELQHGHVHD